MKSDHWSGLAEALERMTPFAYWDSDDHTILAPFIEHWSEHFPGFQVYGDNDVTPLLREQVLGLDYLFQRIRFGAPKSDIARLVLLYEYGGLFTDAHFGITDIGRLHEIIGLIRQYEVIFVWRTYTTQSNRPKEQITPINGVIVARPKSDLVRAIMIRAAEILIKHWHHTHAGHVLFPYSIWHMIGAGNIEQVLLEPGTGNTRVRPEYADRVTFVQEDGAPFQRNVHTGYRLPGMHWSERQNRESLFRD